MKSWLIILLLLGCTLPSFSQAKIFLQIEEIGNDNYIRLVLGDKMRFQSDDMPDLWKDARITKLMPEKSLVILDNGYYKPDQILAYRYTNRGMTIFGGSLLTFSTTWFVFGGLARDMDTQDVIIGMTSAGIGALFSFILNKKTVKFGKKNHLRIMDVRMTVP